MNELNDKQAKAAHSDSSAIVIVAGPGTGKTKTLVTRIEYLINNKKISPDKILALTFTNKAAKEIKDRLEVRGKPFIGTFHGLAIHLLQLNELNIATQKQQLKFVKNRNELNQISRLKNNFETNKLVEQYNSKLKKNNLIDYDDLLLMLYEALKNLKLKSELEYVLVDEFQDTNLIQYEILKLLKAKNYFVIGDPKQSIYSFRGSNEKVLESFYTDFPDCEKITLTQNYRSLPKIILTYSSLFKDVNLNPNKKGDANVYLLETLHDFSEADWIIDYIKSKAGGVDLRDAAEALNNFSDFAILYRKHSLRKIIEKKLKESAVPYQIIGGGSIYEDDEVQDMIAKLKNHEFDHLSAAFEGIKSKETLEDLRSVTQRFGNSTERFLDYYENLKLSEYFDPNINAVTLSTIHSSKGLEFDTVFVIGCEQGLMPNKKADIEEEKRLLYVALSRAKQALYLTKVDKRMHRSTKSSEFLNYLDIEKLIDDKASKKEERLRIYRLKKSQMSMF